MKADKVSFQRLQSVPRRSLQVAQLGGVVQVKQLPVGGRAHVRRKTAGPVRLTIMKQVLGLPVSETEDHIQILSVFDEFVKRRCGPTRNAGACEPPPEGLDLAK